MVEGSLFLADGFDVFFFTDDFGVSATDGAAAAAVCCA